jgi:uncharacterized protein
MRIDIASASEGTTCRGWLYLPTHRPAGACVPAVVMAHGFSAVKKMRLDRFAQAFAAAGLASVVFDDRGLGARHFDPYETPCFADASRAAVAWLTTHLGR